VASGDNPTPTVLSCACLTRPLVIVPSSGRLTCRHADPVSVSCTEQSCSVPSGHCSFSVHEMLGPRPNPGVQNAGVEPSSAAAAAAINDIGRAGQVCTHAATHVTLRCTRASAARVLCFSLLPSVLETPKAVTWVLPVPHQLSQALSPTGRHDPSRGPVKNKAPACCKPLHSSWLLSNA